MKKILTIAALAMTLTLALTACGTPDANTPSGESSSSGSSSSQSTPDGSGESSAPSDKTEATATLCIGMDGSFKEYPVSYTGDLTPGLLISEISKLTGWNLDLSDEITTGKGGMTVSFADTSALVVGPPDPQVEEFFVYDSTELIQMVLDSVQRTLQQNFVDPELGDPASLDIYFALNGEDISVPGTDIVISHTEPYQGFPAAE